MRTKERVDVSAGMVSAADWRRRRVRFGLGGTHVLVMIALAIACLGPFLWMVKGALSPTQELIRHPLAPWPSDPQWGNFAEAWNRLQVGRYMWNTVVLVAGSWFVQVFITTTAAYGLSVLRPWYAKFINAGIMLVLFVPGTVSLVGLYLTVIDLPLLHISIANTPFAIWLVAGVNAFTILVVKRFFDKIPRELFEAARIDGAGAWTIFWRIVLPMSKPIVAVVSLLAIMSAWKEFLWPLIAISDPNEQPISVALQRLADQAELNLLITGMVLATIPPLIIFLMFQRQIINGLSAFSGSKG